MPSTTTRLEHIPNEPTVCSDRQVPCDVAVINIFGFISVPFLSMAAFLLISTLLLMARGRDTDDYGDEDEIDVIEGTVVTDSDDDAHPHYATVI